MICELESRRPYNLFAQEPASSVFVVYVYWHPRESNTVFTSGPSQAWNFMVHAYVTDFKNLVYPFPYKTTQIDSQNKNVKSIYDTSFPS
jgi:hypothetical protein